jgi:DmsE family decaheme c-type cytochrome
MGIKQLLAVIALCLGGAIAPAWGAAGAERSKICLDCHDDLPDMSRSAHATATDARTPDCIACHGPSESHANKKPGQKQGKPDRVFKGENALPASEGSAVCQTCHDRDAKRMLWMGSQHHNADLACSTCHQVHVNQDKVLVKTLQAEVCYTCHKEQRSQASRAFHHPVPEGKMTCSACHNAHGSSGAKLAKRDTMNATCYTCHAEKRGPFVHAHQPVAEDCGNCHNPHGSTVQALLKARPPMLCQQCHTPHVAGGVGAVGGQPGVYPPAAPGMSGPAVTANSSGKNVVNIWQGRSCTNCHTQVHGSNNPSATNPTPNFLFR